MAESLMRRSSVSIACCLILVHTMAVVVIAQVNPPQPVCQCVAEWVGPDLNCGTGGAIECAHGPEFDPDCAPLRAQLTADHPAWTPSQIMQALCSEFNDGTSNCDCFACGRDPEHGCEEAIYQFRAWCGPRVPDQPEQPCITHLKEHDVPLPVRTVYTTRVVANREACAQQDPNAGGVVEIVHCGHGEGSISRSFCGCISDGQSCEVVPNLRPLVQFSRFVQACGPAPEPGGGDDDEPPIENP